MAESIVNLGAGSTGQFLDFVLRNRPSYREGDPSAYTMVDGEFQEAPQYSRNTDDKQRMGETYAGRGMDRDYFYEGFTAEPSAGITEKDIQDKVVRLSDLQDEANFGSPYAGETGVFVPQQVEVVDGKVITNPVGFDNGGIVGQLGELSEMSSDMRDEISQLVNGTSASGAGFLGYEGSTSFLGNGPNGMFGFSQPAYAEATPLLTAGSQRPLPPGFGTRPMRDPGNLVDTNATLSLNPLQLPLDFTPDRVTQPGYGTGPQVELPTFQPSGFGQSAFGFAGGGDVPEGIMSVDLSMGADTTGPDTMKTIPQYPGIEGFDIYKDLAPEQFERRKIQDQRFNESRQFQKGQMVQRDDAVGGKLLKQAGIMTPVDQVKQTVDPKVMGQMSRILGREVV